MRRRPLVRNALSLMAAGAFARGFGMVQRILIVRLAGAEALGLFQMVLPILRTAATVSTLRLPVALTRLTADRLARGDVVGMGRARATAAVLIVALTGLTALLVLPLARPIAHRLLTDPRAELLLYVLPLAFVPSALTGIFRGFAEGRHVMTATAAAQVVEPVVRLAAFVLLLKAWGGKGVAWGALALLVSLGISELGGLLVTAALSGWRSLDSPPSKFHGPTARALLTVALPLWMTTMVNTLAQVVNVGLIPRRLMVAGFSASQATEAYGQLTGMVMPLLYMPMVLVFPVSTVLMPDLASKLAAGQHAGARRQFVKGTVASAAVGIVTSAAFWAAPHWLMNVLYGAPELAPLVRIAALAPVFVYTGNIFASVLHALGKTDTLLLHFVAATGLRLGLVYHLTAEPDLGIAGALWALNADYALTALLNGWAAWRGMARRPAY